MVDPNCSLEDVNQGPEPEDVRAAAVAAVAAFVADAGVDTEARGRALGSCAWPASASSGSALHLAVGDRTLRVESFFMRAPEEQRERLYRDLLLRQATSYVLRFTLDEAGDLFLVGQVRCGRSPPRRSTGWSARSGTRRLPPVLPAVWVGSHRALQPKKPGRAGWPRVPPVHRKFHQVILPFPSWTYASDQRKRPP